MQYSALGTAGVVDFVESADPVDLEARIAAMTAALGAGMDGPALYLMTLAGGGGGHSFVVSLGMSTIDNAPTGVQLPIVACYLAATAEDLPAARQLAINRFGATFRVGPTLDEQLVGASQGTKFMGILLAGAQTIDPG